MLEALRTTSGPTTSILIVTGLWKALKDLLPLLPPLLYRDLLATGGGDGEAIKPVRSATVPLSWVAFLLLKSPKIAPAETGQPVPLRPLGSLPPEPFAVQDELKIQAIDDMCNQHQVEDYGYIIVVGFVGGNSTDGHELGAVAVILE